MAWPAISDLTACRRPVACSVAAGMPWHLLTHRSQHRRIQGDEQWRYNAGQKRYYGTRAIVAIYSRCLPFVKRLVVSVGKQVRLEAEANTGEYRANVGVHGWQRSPDFQ